MTTFIAGFVTSLLLCIAAYVLKIRPDLRQKVLDEAQTGFDALKKKL